ncbi:ClpP family protease [Amycolatopsis suaedae]|uniref:ATP-dependent Clp protease proteolytic subunit n=1 Tax=Amycolatopsis suaedae TaxID=2510978 RepID=A0A4Q7JED7_9PSEU|nr:ATP-dependent Clp protease proteolytic subunit [Amycolatopsis suaedae]RZQ65053.1 ATP-dependent Clp protease proteolytic subunit [Amycolatopsis suaedae]
MTFTDEQVEALLKRRIVLVSGDIDDDLANRVTAQLLLLADDDPVSDITMYVNSNGGSVTAGMAIVDTMRLVRPDVATTVMGLAAGMAQVVATAGAPGKRTALRRAKLLLMRPSGQPDSDVGREVMLRWADELYRITAEASGRPVERVRSDSERGSWFTARRAKTYGLVDHVVDRA